MPQSKLKVVLLRHTPEPEEAVALAAKLCYSSVNIGDLQEKLEAKDQKGFVEKLVKMDHMQMWYDELVEALGDKGEKSNEDARFFLPNAAETKIMVTMNARELLHFFRQRCCNRAQWEIRRMAEEMVRLAQEVDPTIFRTAGPGCISGPCTEGERTCGKIHTGRKRYGVKK